MDCVYNAFLIYMEFLNKPVSGVDYVFYKAMKYATHGPTPRYTFGGVVPWMLSGLGRLHGLRLTMEHRVYSKAHHLLVCDNDIQEWVVRRTDYGEWVRKFTLAPAIYLLLGSQHAVFSTEVVYQHCPTAAFQYHQKPTKEAYHVTDSSCVPDLG